MAQNPAKRLRPLFPTFLVLFPRPRPEVFGTRIMVSGPESQIQIRKFSRTLFRLHVGLFLTFLGFPKRRVCVDKQLGYALMIQSRILKTL